MRPARPWRLLAVLLSTSIGTSAPTQDVSDERSSRTDYVLEARVVPLERDLTGRATITWTNRSSDTVPDLWFHLHLNAYSNNRSTHLWEARGELRGVKVEEGWGWQRVDSLTVDGQDLLPSLTWEVTPGGREEDRTVFSVDLPAPVPPGESVTIDLEWTSKLPRVRRRTGVKEDFVLLSHWFPKLGVYEGGDGWNCHQFHMNSEFYADYGTYDVTLTLPEEYAGKVATSGAAVDEPTLSGGTMTQRFHAPALEDLDYEDPVPTVAPSRPLVHGFAWTADPDYVVHEETFRFEDWKERFPLEVAEAERDFGLEEGSLGLREVKVRVMIQPERAGQAERHAEATMAALFFYGLWFGEYPYSEVTAVDPAWGARAAGGMEYPTLFTCGTSLYSRRRMYRPESVTVHEAGHQFWYALVGNNEYEAAWLDEGLNSYTDSEVLVRTYGKRRSATTYAGLPVWGEPAAAEPSAEGPGGILSGRRWEVLGETFAPLAASPFLDLWRDQPWLTFGEDQADPRWSDRSSYLRAPDADPLDTVSFEYKDRQSYRVNSYPRPAVVLRTLAGVVGEGTFHRGMRRFSREWRYRHPYPEDFYASFAEETEEDVQWYFDELFEGTGIVDWSVEVEQFHRDPARGFFLEDGAYVEVTPPEEDEEEPAGAESPEEGAAEEESPGEEAAEDESAEEGGTSEDGSELWHYDVVVTRSGTLRLPLTIEVTWEDGESRRFEWTREQQAESMWWRLPLEPRDRKLSRVLLDPERGYYIDTNMSDNQWYEQRDEVAPARWAERAWSQYAHLLHWYSTIGG